MQDFPYVVEWTAADGLRRFLSFGTKVAAVGRFDRAIAAGASWACFSNANTGHVYETHGVCVPNVLDAAI